MGGGSLNPAREDKLTAPPSEQALLDRGEFRAAIEIDLGGLHVPTSRGDVVKVRQVGHFLVLAHLAYRRGVSTVRVAQVVGGRPRWGPPNEHPDRRSAVLDALKLVEAFEPGGMSGD